VDRLKTDVILMGFIFDGTSLTDNGTVQWLDERAKKGLK